jgi:hypothetical protein
MLRVVVLLLVAANLGFWAWSQGHLAALQPPLPNPQAGREPERLAQQVKPEAIKLLPPEASAAAATECLESPTLSGEAAQTVRQLLTGKLPSGAWSVQETVEAPTWIVYMGRYNSTAQMEQKKAELRKMNVVFDEVRTSPELQPGLSLGVFKQRANAEKTLEEVGKKGVRSARIETLVPEKRGEVFRVPAADEAARAALAELAPQLPGRGFTACKS